MDKRKEAIKVILSQSRELRRKLLPYLVIEQGELRDIDFDRCLCEQSLSAAFVAATIWMRAIWTQKSFGFDLVQLSFAMDSKFRAAVLRALETLWEES